MAAELRTRAMGSDAHVIVVGDPRLLAEARRRIADLERKWSRFLPDSEISRLNARAGQPLSVSADTIKLVQRGVEGWRATGGHFDPTVLGDVIRAGYDRSFEQLVLDPRGGVSVRHCDCQGIVVDAARRTVTLPGTTGFDPGGFGKGLAADLVVGELLAAGADGACVNLGGDLRADGYGPDDGRWVVAVEHPADRRAVAVLALARGGVATSTVARRSWTVDGGRRHHLIDPATGRPSAGPVVASTALAADAASAEIATKATLLAEQGSELAAFADLGVDGLIVFADGAVRSTSGLARFAIELPSRSVDRERSVA